MNAPTLWVPIQVLNSTTHSASTRLMWLLLGLLRSSAIPFTLCDPVSTRLRARISVIRRKVRKAQHRGEHTCVNNEEA